MQHDSISAADRVNFATFEGIDSALQGLCGDRGGTGEGTERQTGPSNTAGGPTGPRFDVPKLDISLRD